VLALAPPHPDSGNDVHATHRALRGGGVLGGRVRGNSTTQLPVVPYGLLVNAALCEGLSDDACLELNDEFHRQTRKLNTVYQTSGGYLKVLVLCVRFSNHVDWLLPTTEQLHVLFNAADPDPDLTPTGSEPKTTYDMDNYREFSYHPRLWSKHALRSGPIGSRWCGLFRL
jgi:hypothetical protein